MTPSPVVRSLHSHMHMRPCKYSTAVTHMCPQQPTVNDRVHERAACAFSTDAVILNRHTFCRMPNIMSVISVISSFPTQARLARLLEGCGGEELQAKVAALKPFAEVVVEAMEERGEEEEAGGELGGVPSLTVCFPAFPVPDCLVSCACVSLSVCLALYVCLLLLMELHLAAPCSWVVAGACCGG